MKQTLNLESLRQGIKDCITPNLGGFMCDCAVASLHGQNHKSKILLHVKANNEEDTLNLVWTTEINKQLLMSTNYLCIFVSLNFTNHNQSLCNMTAMTKKSAAKMWHDKAMNLSQDALVLQLTGQKGFIELYAEAFGYEQQAAMQFLNALDKEPTRSVLFRSAASLAIQCHKFSEAERLIDIGLSGNPPKIIAIELKALQEQIKKQLMQVA